MRFAQTAVYEGVEFKVQGSGFRDLDSFRFKVSNVVGFVGRD
jgi:hypothetical protein